MTTFPAPVDVDQRPALAAIADVFERFQSRQDLLQSAAEVADALLAVTGCLITAADAPGRAHDVEIHGHVAARLHLPPGCDAAPVSVDSVCRIIGAALEKHRTRQLLEARYVSWTLACRDGRRRAGDAINEQVLAGLCDPDKVARVLGRAFFLELHKAGFESGAVLTATAEMVATMTETLQQNP